MICYFHIAKQNYVYYVQLSFSQYTERWIYLTTRIWVSVSRSHQHIHWAQNKIAITIAHFCFICYPSWPKLGMYVVLWLFCHCYCLIHKLSACKLVYFSICHGVFGWPLFSASLQTNNHTFSAISVPLSFLLSSFSMPFCKALIFCFFWISFVKFEPHVCVVHVLFSNWVFVTQSLC